MRTACGARGRAHVWLPGVRRTGGIQRFSAHFVDALCREWAAGRHRIYLKNDVSAPPSLQSPNVRFHGSGRFPDGLRTPVFAARIATSAMLRRPDLLVIGHLNFGAVSSRLPSFAARSRWLLVYGIEAWNVVDPVLIRVVSSADRILAISRYTADRLGAEQDLDPDRISILPCTFDPSLFRRANRPRRLMRRHKLSYDQPVMLTVARLAGSERRKGYDLVLDALPRIRRSLPDIRYVLVGDGPDRDRLEEVVRDAGLQQNVVFAGYVPDEELVDFYNLCDLFAMPGAREGFGIVYLEAMACGKPVIGGNADGAVDALGGGRLGALVDPEDPVELAETAVAILERRYPLPILYEPDRLRTSVVAEFGPEAFRRRVRRFLKEDGFVDRPPVG